MASPVTVALPSLGPADELGRACDVVKAGGVGLAVVTDEDGCLRGVLSDLALRQALAAGHPLHASVADVMADHPVVVPVGASAVQARAVLLEHRLTVAPVVDVGRAVGVARLTELGGIPGPDPVALIVAGGRGERLRPLTDRVPKPLLRVGGCALIERIIRRLADAGVREIHIAVNYLAELFEAALGDGDRFGVRLRYVVESMPLGTAGALSLLGQDVAGPVLVTNADLVTDVDYGALLAHHWHHNASATVAASWYRTAVPYGVLRTDGGLLASIEEKPCRQELVGAGMYVLSADAVRAVPRGRPTDMPDLIAELAASTEVGVFPLFESWHDVGTPQQFEEVLVKFATGWNQ